MATFARDTFTDTDGVTHAGHVGETGATWTPQTGNAGGFIITANRARSSAAGALLASGIPSGAEYDIEADVYSHGTAFNAHIVGRADPASYTYYSFRYNGGNWQQIKWVNGVNTFLGGVAGTVTAATTYTMRLEVKNASKRALINGVQVLSVTDNTITSTGRIGIGELGALAVGVNANVDSITGIDPSVATQTAYATADVTDGLWTNEAASNINLFASIDEATASDTDYIQSDASPATASPVRLGLGALNDPGVNTGHIVRYRLGKDMAGGDALTVTARLYQGATLISTDPTVRTVPDAFTTYSWTLSGTEADSIGNYNDLRLEFSAIKI